MKTYVVLTGGGNHMTNAESPEEAVAYAIARAGLIADVYVVRDHDSNEFIVKRGEVLEKDVAKI